MTERAFTRTLAQRAAGLAAACVLLAGPQARANDYGVFVEAAAEEDLLDLLVSQEIDQSDFDALVELLADGVDLNSAGRDELYALPNLTYSEVDAIIAYREEAGAITNPADLVAAGLISERKLLAMAAFLVVSDLDPPRLHVRGRFRYGSGYVLGDEQIPSMWLSTRADTLKYLTLGLTGVVNRNRLGQVAYDPNRDALSAEEPRARFILPKFFVQWQTPTLHAVAGTYRIGFGQRLTFDNTTWYAPNGIRPDDAINYNQNLSRLCRESDAGEGLAPCPGVDTSRYGSPDFRWTDRLRGAAVGLRRLPLGDGWLQAYGWLSHQTRGIYQYEIYDRARCADPTDDHDPACKAPWVYRRQEDLLAATSRFSYQTLPDMFNELLAGANLSYFIDRRFHLGLTGYGARVDWLVQGMDLDFQEWSRLPYGGPFGAVGFDLAWGRGLLDLFLEAARSFDSQPAGGGLAAVLRSTLTLEGHEFEAALRYYDTDFANPYARPISAPDQYDGLRARDEAGLRLRYFGRLADLQLRARADLWANPSDRTRARKLALALRADYRALSWATPGLWFEFQDRDLGQSDHQGVCYETPFEQTPEGEPVPCTGSKLLCALQLSLEPLRQLSIVAKYLHRWLDDQAYDHGLRQDMSAWLTITLKLADQIRLRGQARYLFEDVDRHDRLERSLWTFLEAVWLHRSSLRLRLRYELLSWLDQRASTAARSPNPVHWLRLEMEYRF